jgi:hypothetical protein
MLEDAEAAGDVATAFGEPAPDATMGWYSVPYPHYIRYVVIPGAGVLGPARSVHCTILRGIPLDGVCSAETDGILYRHKKHFGVSQKPLLDERRMIDGVWHAWCGEGWIAEVYAANVVWRAQVTKRK